VPLARVPVRLEPVTTAESSKQAPIPAIRKAEIHFDNLFGSLCCAERGANPVDCGGCGISLSRRCGAFKEGRNLAQFLTKFLFSGQFVSFSFPEQTWSKFLRTMRILSSEMALQLRDRQVIADSLQILQIAITA
jgi:hypothetical protein